MMIRGSNIRIVIADQHVMLAQGCQKLLEPEFEVVAIASSTPEAKAAVAELHPDIVVTELDLPPSGGVALCEAVLAETPRTKIVCLTTKVSTETAAQLFRIGVWAYALKQTSASELRQALRKVARGEHYLSPMLSKNAVEFLARGGYKRKQVVEDTQLTSLQWKIVELFGQGMSIREVAVALGIQVGTAADHKYRIMRKLHLAGSYELLKFALMHGAIIPASFGISGRASSKPAEPWSAVGSRAPA